VCRELEEQLSGSCHLTGNQSDVEVPRVEVTGTQDGCDLTPAGTQRSEVKAESPLPRSRCRRQCGLRLSSSMSDLNDTR